MNTSQKGILSIIIFLHVFIPPIYADQIWCPDLAKDEAINFNDFVIFADNWGQSGFSLQGDFDNNSSVDIFDLKVFANWWLADYGCKEADFNLDYSVNFLDFAKLADKWLTDSNDAGWNSTYDLDDSNSINIYDLRLFTERWMEFYPEPNEVFDMFKDALVAGDVDTALTFITDSAKEQYTDVLTQLQPHFQNMVAGMGDLVLISMDADTAKYEMRHDEGGGVISSFPVYFSRDEHGNWNIYCF